MGYGLGRLMPYAVGRESSGIPCDGAGIHPVVGYVFTSHRAIAEIWLVRSLAENPPSAYRVFDPQKESSMRRLITGVLLNVSGPDVSERRP
jgi:hypothetical protein